MTETISGNSAQRRIANWLAHTRNVDIAIDAVQEHVARKARQLRQAILEGSLEPESLIVDEDLKEALSALVTLLAASETTASEKLELSNAVYQFIDRLAWMEDPLNEKRDLLLECAEIGWSAIGLSVAEVTRRRPARGSVELPQSKTDSISLLADDLNSAPRTVAEKAAAIHDWLKSGEPFEGLFDEKQYFLGQTALLVASAFRILGKHEETENWLARAEAGFRHTLNPAPSFASMSYVRLALLYDKGRFDEVVDLAPSLAASFAQLGMQREEGKAHLLRAAALKVSGRTGDSLIALESLLRNASIQEDPQLKARVLIDVGDAHQIEGQLGKSLIAFQEASVLLQKGTATGVLGDLKLDIGALLRGQGHLSFALEAFREGLRVLDMLEMSTRAAYAHVLIAETLLELGRHREAEWELLAALPTIEEQKMVPEGFAAVALLKESVRRRKTDPNALRELREHLQASK